MSLVKETYSMLPSSNIVISRDVEANMHPKTEDRIVSVMQGAVAASESTERREPPRKICRVDAGSKLDKCEVEMLRQLEKSELDLNVQFLKKITVAQVANYSPVNKKDFVEKFASIAMDDVVLGKDEDFCSMPFVKFVHLSVEQLNSCIDKVPSSLMPLVASCRGEYIDPTKLSSEQLLSFLNLFESSSVKREQAIAIQCFDNLLPRQIDAILFGLNPMLLRMIIPSQLRQLTFASVGVCTNILLKMFPCPGDKLAYILCAKMRFSHLSYDAVNTIFSYLTPDLMRLISDDQLLHLNWNCMKPCDLSNLFPTASKEDRKESGRRINLLPQDKREKILGKLSPELTALIN